jgi:cysteamine dioxygenase
VNDAVAGLEAAARVACDARDVSPLVSLLDPWCPPEQVLDHRLATLNRAVPWSSLTVARSDAVSLDLFFMPRGATIPLHDHPGMLGVVRVLRGVLSVTGYSWAPEGGGLALPHPHARGTAGGPPLVLWPEPGTVHTVTALEDAAFLDLFAPPYEPQGARPCTYYRVERRLSDGRVVLAVQPRG